MRAVLFERYGDAGVLREAEVPDPEPTAGTVRLRVAATAFNPADAGLRGGWLRDAFPLALPAVPGYDVSGVVDAVGPDAPGLAVGDRVAGFTDMVRGGGAATRMVAAAAALVRVPDGVDLVGIAALPSTGATADQALFRVGGLTSGQRVLVNGAGGAVGRLAVQLAHRAGARVVATTGRSTAERVAELGADEVLGHDADLAALPPFDVVLNLGSISADALAALAALVRQGGVLVNTVPSIAPPSGDERGVRVETLFVRPDAARLADLVGMVARGELEVDVAERLPLADLADVHARSDRGELRGKVVLVPPAA